MADAASGSYMRQCRTALDSDMSSLSDMLMTGPGARQVKAEILQIMQQEPIFDKTSRPFLSRAQLLHEGVTATRRLIELRRQHRWNDEQFSMAIDLLDNQPGIVLHELAFKPVLASQCSDEQQAYWLPLANNYAILGCYAQTELGHGSNVQRLETTATYHPDTEEFELHSPTLSSTKWWIGGLGVLATHSLVQAQLLLPDGDRSHKSYGPHLFLLRIRTENGHEPGEGITIGEIGPKAHGAFAATDNGYMRLDKVRVPRDAMLARFAQVTKEGKYVMPPHAKLSYGGMIYIRANMISSLGWSLAKAVTISTRYLHERRQFSDKSGEVERPVITYPSVYMRIAPALAKAYVFIMAGHEMRRRYTSLSSGLEKGDTTLLASTHAIAAGLKLYVSSEVVEECESCRRACGGHGFLQSAGLSRIYASVLPAVTYEGENYILAQQALDSKRKLSLPECTALLELRAKASVAQLRSRMSGSPQTTWSTVSWECMPVAIAVTEASIAEMLVEIVGRLSDEDCLVSGIFELWCLHRLERAASDLLGLSIISPPQFQKIREQYALTAATLQPKLIGLSDAFKFSDWELNSTIGRTAGQPYSSLLDVAIRTAEANLGQAEYASSIRAILEAGAKQSSAQRQHKM